MTISSKTTYEYEEGVGYMLQTYHVTHKQRIREAGECKTGEMSSDWKDQVDQVDH